MDTQNKILTKEQDVNCSKKHCHSKDLSHRQCQRFSMIFPTDNKIEILLCEMAEFCCLCLYFFLCCSANCAHWSFTVFINWLCDSMSWCKTWKMKQKLGWYSRKLDDNIEFLRKYVVSFEQPCMTCLLYANTYEA